MGGMEEGACPALAFSSLVAFCFDTSSSSRWCLVSTLMQEASDVRTLIPAISYLSSTSVITQLALPDLAAQNPWLLTVVFYSFSA